MSISKIDSGGITASGITADSLDVGQIGGRRNLIINGNFDINQRSSSSRTTEGYLVDRWRLNLSGATATLSSESFTLGQTDVVGANKYVKLDVTVGNGNCSVSQAVEDVRTAAGQTVTLSFYAKGINPGGGHIVVDYVQRFGSGGSETVTTQSDDIVITSTWQKYTVTISIPSVSGATLGSGHHLGVEFRQPDGDASTNAWELNLAQVQLEVGTVATPFEHRSYGEELALCQRYYFKPHSSGGQLGQYFGSTGLVFCFPFQTEMRVTPSVVDQGTITFNVVGQAGGVTANGNGSEARSRSICSINYGSASRSESSGEQAVVTNTGDVAFSAEL